jgi:GT2 family glycosyltransferase
VDDGSVDEPFSDDYHALIFDRMPSKKQWKNPCVPLNKAVRNSKTPLILLQSPETYHETPCAIQMQSSMNHYKDVVLATVRTEGIRKPWYAHPVHRPKRYWFCQMMSRQFFDEVGGFDERYREGQGWDDDEFERRLTRAGANWIWREDCVAVHVATKRKLHPHRNKRLFEKDA